MTRVLEGTWQEIAAHADEWNGRRLRVEIRVEENGAVTDGNGGVIAEEEFSLAERLKGRTGRVAFEPDDLAARSEEYFGAIVEEKHRLRRERS